MALICNGYRFGHMPHAIVTGSLTTMYYGRTFRDISLTGRTRNISAGEGITSEKVGLPEGYRHPAAWMMPQKAGSLSSHNNTLGVGSATLTMVKGMAIAGTSDGTCTVTATAKLVVSTSATADGVATVSATLIAVLELSGSSDGEATISGTVGANAWCSGAANGSCTATMTSYATGSLSGSIFVNQSEATVRQLVDGVWGGLASEFDESGTMGEKMNAAGTAGDPWTADVSAYAEGTAGNKLNKLKNPKMVVDGVII